MKPAWFDDYFEKTSLDWLKKTRVHTKKFHHLGDLVGNPSPSQAYSKKNVKI